TYAPLRAHRWPDTVVGRLPSKESLLSPLTKIFVILLVVLSLVSNAAFIVYINKEDIQKDSLTKVQAKLTAADTSVQNLQAQLSAAQLNLQSAQTDANAKANAASNE